MERKRRMRGYIVVCLLFALLMSTGCTSAQQDFSSEERPYPDENMTVIGVSQLGSESMWRSANTASIQQVFTKENGYFLMYNNARQKQENQIKAIRSFISQQVDYIIFSPIVESGWDTVLKEAKEAGCTCIGGKGMLLWQGVAAFKLYTGMDMPVDEVKEKFFS